MLFRSLALSPEGTRRRVERWKTGFLRIAAGAGVPIVPVWIDYPAQVVGLGPAIHIGPDPVADLAKFQGMFRKSMAKFPERFAE